MKTREQRLKSKIENALIELFNPASAKTAEEKAEIRDNVNTAMKWYAILQKTSDKGWGSGFSNGKAATDD